MSGKKLEMRKVLLFLPLVLLPFLALGFYALGGGSVVKMVPAVQGINTALPDAQLKKADPKDKLGIYELAGKDSSGVGDGAGANGVKDVADRLRFEPAVDPKAKEIRAKLAVISRQVNGPVGSVPGSGNRVRGSGELPGSGSGGVSSGPGGVDQGEGSGAVEVLRLERMMKELKNQGSAGDDLEMRQLNALMDKVLDVQNPERVKERLLRGGNGSGSGEPGSGDGLGPGSGTGSGLVVPDPVFRAIPAMIEGKQKVAEGSSVKMRLLDTMMVNGQVIPKGSLVWGLASVANHRLLLEIKNIGLDNAIIPVSLTVFDRKDAMVGIDAPEALMAEVAGSGADNALQGMQFLGMDQSLGVQAAGAGITAAKTLFNKKVRKIRVKLRAGYPLLLRDNARSIR
jgi:hypothetical protein